MLIDPRAGARHDFGESPRLGRVAEGFAQMSHGVA
jgi:hypothetical protein